MSRYEFMHDAKMRCIIEHVLADFDRKYVLSETNPTPTVLQCPYLPAAEAEVDQHSIHTMRSVFGNYILDKKRSCERIANPNEHQLRDPPPPATEVPNGTSPGQVRKQRKPGKKAKPHGGA
jgi:hypothetical protein